MKHIKIYEDYDDPLKGLEIGRDMLGLSYQRDIETGGFSGEFYIEGPKEFQEEADAIVDQIEDALEAVRDEYDDLVNGEGEALEQIANTWDELRSSDIFRQELAAIGYTLKEHED